MSSPSMLVRKNLYAFSSEDPTGFGRHIAKAAQEDPVYFDEGIGMPGFLRGADVMTALKDAETFTTRGYNQGLLKGALVALEGEAHARMRRLYNQFFAPRAIARYEEKIVKPIAVALMDKLAKKERADLIDDFAIAMPIGVVSALFGLPAENIVENDVHVRAMMRAVVRPHIPELAAEGWSAYHAVAGQLREISAREIASPSDNLLGEIAKALISEGLGTIEECERVVLTLILASYETTIWMLASVIVAMLENPEARAQVRADPALVPAAIDEANRWCGSAVGLVRFVEKDTTLGGVALSAGSFIYLALSGVNYETATYENPEVYDLRRKAAPLTFGLGPHYCVGAPLARMEARVGLSLLLERFPALRADPAKRPVFSTSPRGAASFGPDHLPVLLT